MSDQLGLPTFTPVGTAFLPAATNPTTAGVRSNGTAAGYCSLQTFVRSSVGVYTINVQEDAQSSSAGLSSSECQPLTGSRTTGGTVGCVFTSQTLLTLSAIINNAAADCDTDVFLFKTKRST